jgi:hypothetical protein
MVSRLVSGRSIRMTGQANLTEEAVAVLRRAWVGHTRRIALTDHVRAVSRFNLAQSGQPVADGPTREDIDRLQRDTVSRLRSLMAERQWFSSAAACERAIVVAGDFLDRAVQTAATAPEPTTREALAGAVDAADGLRTLLALIATLRWCEWQCLWPVATGADRLARAASLPLRWPTARSLAQDIGELPDRARRDGRAIAVRAVITALGIDHEGAGKPVTTMMLRDPESGDELAAKVFGFKADSTGAVTGSAVRLDGVWDTARNAVRVGRAALREEAESGFAPYLAWSASEVYIRTPHALQLNPSWNGGFDGPLNPVRYNVFFQPRATARSPF